MGRHATWLCALIATLLAGCPGPNASVQSGSSLKGQAKLEVTGNQAGISVTIAGNGLTQTTQTDALSTYALRGLLPGHYTVTAHFARYFDQQVGLDYGPGSPSVPLLTLQNHQVLMNDPSLMGHANFVLSPDGKNLAVASGSVILLLPVGGGAPIQLCKLPIAANESVTWIDWSAKTGRLLFAKADSSSVRTYSLCAMNPGDTSAQTLVQGLGFPLTTPVWSPLGDRIAFLRDRTSERDASGSGHVDLMVANADGSASRSLEVNPINPIYDGIEPLEWNQWGLLYHRPMTCNTVTYRLDPDTGKPYPVADAGDGIYYFAPDLSSGPFKIYYYSYPAHCWSVDGKSIVLGISGSVRTRALDYPGDYNQGTVPVGYTRYDDKRDFVLDSDGKTLYFESPLGIERMNLLD